MADPLSAASAEILFALPGESSAPSPSPPALSIMDAPTESTPCDECETAKRVVVYSALVTGAVLGALFAYVILRGSRR